MAARSAAALDGALYGVPVWGVENSESERCLPPETETGWGVLPLLGLDIMSGS